MQEMITRSPTASLLTAWPTSMIVPTPQLGRDGFPMAGPIDPFRAPAPRPHRDGDVLRIRKPFRQRRPGPGQSRRFLLSARSDDTAVGGEHADHVADRHHPGKPERGAADLAEQRTLRQGDVAVPPPPRLSGGVGGRGGFGGRRGNNPVKLTHPVDRTIAARPDHCEPAAITEYPPDLRDGPLRIHPMPRRRDEDPIRARLGQRDHLTSALHDAHPVSYTHLRAHETDSYLV